MLPVVPGLSGHRPGGPGESPASGRSGLMLAAAALLYAAGFLLWFPSALSITDEAHYVAGALALVHARGIGAVTGFTAATVAGLAPTMYPVGTSVLQAPWVAAMGWHAAALASVLGFCGVAALLWRWLREAGETGWSVWLWFGFPPALALGRLAMSDIPGTACVAVGLFAFWRGSQPGSGWRPWFIAGLATGGSLLFREPLVLMLGPFALGALLRRDTHRAWLVSGVAVGIGLRLLSGAVVYGHPLAHNPTSFGFSRDAWRFTVPFYGSVLLALVPGALLWMPRYRGWRWPECQVATWGTVAFFLCYNYAGVGGGGLKQVVLGGRFMLPLLPLLVWCAPSTLGAWWETLRARQASRILNAVPALWVLAVVAGVVAVHPVLAAWDRQQRRMADVVERATEPGAAIVTVTEGTSKLVHPGNSTRHLVAAVAAPPAALPELQRRFGAVYVLGVERSDSELMMELSAGVDNYLADVSRECVLMPVVEQEVDPGTRLRILRVGTCGGRARLGTGSDAQPLSEALW